LKAIRWFPWYLLGTCRGLYSITAAQQVVILHLITRYQHGATLTQKLTRKLLQTTLRLDWLGVGLTSYCLNNQPHLLAEQLLQNTLAGLEHMYVHTFHSLVSKHPIKLKFIW